MGRKRIYRDENHKSKEQDKRKKLWAVKEMGGKCSRCGYDKSIKALDFHHVDPTNKVKLPQKSLTQRSWSFIMGEIKKCILLCRNCHSEIHEELENLKYS